MKVPPFKPHKFRAKPTGGYASKREAQYADLLRARKEAGEIRDWMEQVPVRMSGKRLKYVIDFMVIENDWTVRFVEVKGVATEAWKIKMNVLAHECPSLYERLEVVR